jgi:hypothetical protein
MESYLHAPCITAWWLGTCTTLSLGEIEVLMAVSMKMAGRLSYMAQQPRRQLSSTLSLFSKMKTLNMMWKLGCVWCRFFSTVQLSCGPALDLWHRATWRRVKMGYILVHWLSSMTLKWVHSPIVHTISSCKYHYPETVNFTLMQQSSGLEVKPQLAVYLLSHSSGVMIKKYVALLEWWLPRENKNTQI